MHRAEERFTLRGDGRNLIDFMYVDDAVDALLRLVTAPAGTRITVDLASGSPVPIAEIVGAMARAVGREVAVDFEGETEEYIEFRSGDRTMADRFGFRPRVPFETGVRRLDAFLADHEDAAVRG